MLRSALLAAKAKAEGGDGNNISDENSNDGSSKSGNVTPSRPLNGGSSTPRSASGGGFGIVSFKPFRLPSSKLVRDVPQRLANAKRKRINYKEDAPDEEDSDGGGKKAKKRSRDGDGAYNDADGGEEGLMLKVYPTYEPKPAASVFSAAFSIPVMKDKKTGAVIETRLSFGALGVCRRPNVIPRPLHDPLADHAIVLWDPTVDDIETEEDKQKREEAEKEAAEKKKLQDKSGVHKSLAAMLGIDKLQDKDPSKVKVPVVIDPRLCKTLRPHQVEGVKFLYKATTGMIAEGAHGCIMADEMGLGKTLQCISLLWTLLKQSPRSNKGTIDKAIVTCPASLVRNWANEIVKWLGPNAINPLAIDGSKPKHEVIADIRQWCSAHGRAIVRPVIIVSYETLRSLTEELGNSPVGLLMCDEAHRLKNSQNQTYMALNSINVKRRVLLTGTPIQNDLTEYFALLDFAVPGYLGTRVEFKKNFENAIMHGRNADASELQIEKCQAKLKELTTLVNRFVIRRTNDLLTKYLPVKYEHVVFCSLSPFQLALYRLFVSSPEIKALIRGKGSNPLVAIGMLQKLCNHPDLVNLERDLPGSEKLFPEGYTQFGRKREVWPALSGKMLVLERFLDKMRAESDDKIVLISNYTETLDVIERMLNAKRYGYFRLEGSTNIKKRQKLVDQFNDPEGKEFVFLLSSKAGGCGINLIGANRLVLFDPDWNPAADQQALARVWRDGQKKNCFVYRFIATGTLEEKIFQRQAHKQALSACVVDDNGAAERHFSRDNLRQLFDYREDTISETHDTFKCKRCKGGKQLTKAPAMLYGDTSTWNHFCNADLKDIHDDLLRAETDLSAVTAVFQFISS